MTIKKVATIAGVSIATVSRYFNSPNQVSKETRERVEVAIKRINYTPNKLAQNLRRGKTGLIIAVVPKISSPAYEAIMKQLNLAAIDKNYNLLVKEANTENLNLHYYQEMLRCKQADGFILLTGLPDETDRTLMKKPLPIVLAYEPLPNNTKVNLPSIIINHYRAAKEATQYLIGLGHQNISFLTPHPQQLSSTQHQAGFLRAMDNHNFPVFGRVLPQQYDQAPTAEKLKRLLDVNPTPTAIFCNDDDAAIEVIQLLKQEGLRIPQDISVMGFNNIRYGELSAPPLSSVSLPTDVIGVEAIDLLLKLIDDQSHHLQPIILKHSLVIRHSTGVAPQTEQSFK